MRICKHKFLEDLNLMKITFHQLTPSQWNFHETAEPFQAAGYRKISEKLLYDCSNRRTETPLTSYKGYKILNSYQIFKPSMRAKCVMERMERYKRKILDCFEKQTIHSTTALCTLCMEFIIFCSLIFCILLTVKSLNCEESWGWQRHTQQKRELSLICIFSGVLSSLYAEVFQNSISCSPY